MILGTDDSDSHFKDEWLLKKFCLDILSDQNQNCSDKCQFWSENVRCPITISSTGMTIIQHYLKSSMKVIYKVLCNKTTPITTIKTSIINYKKEFI